MCFCTDVSAVQIQNKLLAKCLQVQGGRVSLDECTPHSALQEWKWFPEHQALMSQQSGGCLTASGEQYEGVQLKPCVFQAGEDTDGTAEDSQAWSCSKKGHLTLIGGGLHLSASSESTLVFLSREHKHVRTDQSENLRLSLDCELTFTETFPFPAGQQVARP